MFGVHVIVQEEELRVMRVRHMSYFFLYPILYDSVYYIISSQ